MRGIFENGSTSDESVPAGFDVQVIPTVFVVGEGGKDIKKYEGNPHNFKKLTDFALAV